MECTVPQLAIRHSKYHSNYPGICCHLDVTTAFQKKAVDLGRVVMLIMLIQTTGKEEAGK